MNFETLNKLQYNTLKEILKNYCISSYGKNLIDKLEPSSNIKVVKSRLAETSEGRQLLDILGYIPLEGLFNIDNIISKVEKDMILEATELTHISDFLRGTRKTKDFMTKHEAHAPILSSYSSVISIFLAIEEEINSSIKGSRVDSNASKELKKIRRLIDDTEERIEDRLNKFLNNKNNREYIGEFFISKRNDRYTIPIKASYKNHVEGTIVETSSKGSTVFIEPSVISRLTSGLIELKVEESIEEYKILSALTNLVFNKLKEIKINLDLMGQYDMIFAKAKYSRATDGIEPKINNHGYIKLVKCKHPLLSGNVVPLDIEVGKDYRSLIITGPNAGGKTVVLKTVGLLTILVQSGIHISCDPSTEVAIFNNIFIDIGDNQSIENALSTFSSHIKNLSDIMKASGKNTLVLFDEIGSGTDPNEGAALAISILEEFYHMGCITIASTHYGEIKRFSESHNDFENACMKFNPETLEPLYKLIIGKSGESNALWISKRMGLRQDVLDRARKYIDTKNYNLNLVRESKITKEEVVILEDELKYEFKVGDKVYLLDKNGSALIYKERDKFNNLVVLYNDEFMEVNYKRVSLEFTAEELYPKDYDLNTLFISYTERKLQHDIERGSKKALKKLQKEAKNKA